MKTKEKILLAVILFLVGTGGYLIGRVTAPEKIAQQPVEVVNSDDELEVRAGGGYRFINPLLECENYQPSRMNSIVMMRSEVQSYLLKVEEEKKATFVSVYFRSLNLGPWMGLNEKENFSPASLLKVPIMIAALKKAEQDPVFLKKKIAYTQQLEKSVAPNITDKNLIKIGKSYSIEELIQGMIQHSDNEAKELLLRNLDGAFVLKVMADIGINVSGNMNVDFVSVKDYSGFFRLLYNATYLNHEMSEKALSILSTTSFTKGIVAGVPQGITVAHKFGERAYAESNLKQLHECGIVYEPGSPYLICVMTRGNDFNQLAGIISDISGIIYRNVKEYENI